FQGATRMLRLTGLDHIGLKVLSMSRTLDFYQRLGITLLRTSGPNAAGERSAVMQVGNQELNIFSHPAASAGLGQPLGMDPLSLTVDAAWVDDVIAGLRQIGIDIVKGPEKRRDGMALSVHDPDGVRVKLQLKRTSAT